MDKASSRVACPQLKMEKDVTLLLSGRGLDKIMPIAKLLYRQYRITEISIGTENFIPYVSYVQAGMPCLRVCSSEFQLYINVR